MSIRPVCRTWTTKHHHQQAILVCNTIEEIMHHAIVAHSPPLPDDWYTNNEQTKAVDLLYAVKNDAYDKVFKYFNSHLLGYS